MKDANYTQRLKERKKRALGKNLFFNLLLLIPPLLCLAIIILTALVTFSLSLFLIYFILPMFYTVDKRLRYNISGIGKPDFSYADGYKDFFTASKGGIFGVIMTIFSAVAFILLFYLIFSATLEPLINCFPDASTVWKDAVALMNQEQIDEAVNLLQDNIVFLVPPITIFCGIIGFIPSLYVIFYAINNNLNNIDELYNETMNLVKEYQKKASILQTILSATILMCERGERETREKLIFLIAESLRNVNYFFTRISLIIEKL